MADFNSTTFFLRSATSLFDVFAFDAVFVDALEVVLEDVLVVLEDVLEVVLEGGLLRFFGAGRVDFAASLTDLAQTTLID